MSKMNSKEMKYAISYSLNPFSKPSKGNFRHIDDINNSTFGSRNLSDFHHTTVYGQMDKTKCDEPLINEMTHSRTEQNKL